MKSLNNRKQVQSDFLKQVERTFTEEAAEQINKSINLYVEMYGELPNKVRMFHYRSLASGISKPVKYQNKVK